MSVADEPYLEPYVRAAEKFGAGFGSLLWASPRTQQTRFRIIQEMHNPAGKILLDVGCGRADYLAFLAENGAQPATYIGIEGVDALAHAARNQFPIATIINADFVRQPLRMFVGADVVIFSGSLNTLTDDEFYPAVRRAYDAATEAVVFNFLSSDYLTGREYLFWRPVEKVQQFAREFCGDVRLKFDYLKGDATVCLRKPLLAEDNCEDLHA